jgi:Zn-dependent membrane protease YugP
MHPVVILVPAAVLIFGPRLWVSHVLNHYNKKDCDFPLNASELARELLDRHGLQAVKVEITDRGDHYDPVDRSVRIARDKQGRKTLTAVTTAAHEVSHALQHADDYGPFLWRTRLAKLAQVTGEVGSGLLFAVPAAALLSRNPVPPTIIGVAALSILGTGVAAQLAALPSELDASFNRALPMLRRGYINAAQSDQAHRILLACSLTYVASSMAAILNIWPWIGGAYVRQPVGLVSDEAPATTFAGVPEVARHATASSATASPPRPSFSGSGIVRRPGAARAGCRLRRYPGASSIPRPAEVLLRAVLKPAIHCWFRLTD